MNFFDEMSDSEQNKPIKENDRRETFRVPARLYIECEQASPEETRMLEQRKEFNVKITTPIDEDPFMTPVNMSSSGIGFGTNQHFEKNSFVRLRLAQPETSFDVTLFGQVTRCINARVAHLDCKEKYWLGLKFVQISHELQPVLNKFTIQQQHKNLKHLFRTKNS